MPSRPARCAPCTASTRPRRDRYAYYGGGDVPVRLADFGPALWPALQQVVDAGVTLMTTAGAPVRLAGEPATVAVDVREAGDGGLLVRPSPTWARCPVPAEAVGLLGSPPHGAVLLSGVAGLPAGLVPDGGLLLTAVQRVPGTARGLVTAGPLSVPAADRVRFLADFYPALGRALPVRSSDGSVELPEVHGPELCLRVDHVGGHRARLAWSVQYRTGDDVRRLPLPRIRIPPAAILLPRCSWCAGCHCPSSDCRSCGRPGPTGWQRRPSWPAWTPSSS